MRTDLKKIFAKDISDKRLLGKIYKHLFTLNNKNTDNQIKKSSKHCNG
jgi:hypothetical protein